MLGRGLYTAALSNRALAKQYGKVQFVLNAIPKNPKKFEYLNDWEIWEYNTMITNFCKEEGVETSKRYFHEKTSIEAEMMKLGYDGIIIKGRETVNYTPENVLYFSTEKQLIDYYYFLNGE